jgi:hypothetical protein
MSGIIDDLAPALVERWALLPAATEWDAEVVRGLPVDGLGVKNIILVELDGDPSARDNSTFTQDPIDMTMTRYRELGEIRCTALAQTGSKDLDRMSRVASQLAAACAADLVEDMTVGGIVWSARVTQGSAQQVKNDRGVAVIVPFTVAYAAQV